MSKEIQYFDIDYKDELREKRNELNNIVLSPPAENISVKELNLYLDKKYFESSKNQNFNILT